MKDYYSVLKIAPGVGPSDIKKAYRQLALQYHPDRNLPTASKEKFIEITEAYEVLSDHNERVKYDRLRREQKERPQGAQQPKAQRAKAQKERNREAERRTREQERRWEERGREKAETYWRMEFNKFIQEVKGGSSTHIYYSFRFLFLAAFFGSLIIVIIIWIFNTLEARSGAPGDEAMPFVLLLVLLLACGFAYMSLANAVWDYNQES